MEKDALEGQDLTKGDIRKQLWSLAWPMMLSIFFYTLYNIVDAYWVSKLSAEAIAAVSISQITLIIMISLGFGVTAGSGVLMAMHIGARDKREAERILGQSFVLSAILGAIFTVIALLFSDQLLTLTGASGAIFQPAKEYFLIVAGGSILLFVMMAVMFSFNSQGDTHTLTKFFAISTAINVVLDPIMIFGWAGIPAMGIAGAAIATLISQAVFIILAVRELMQPHRELRFAFSNLTMKWKSVKKVLNIGFPAALTELIFPIGLALLTLIVAQRYQEPGAIAFSLGFRIEFFAYLPAVGFGFAAMAIMSQSMGAGNLSRARESFRKALAYASGAALALGVIVAVFAGPVIRIFTNDPVVMSYASSYMWIVALLSFSFLAAVLVEAPAFQSIGRSWPGFWIFFLRVAVITVPLSYLFTWVWNLPIASVWAAIAIGNAVSAIIGYFWITRLLETYKPEEIPVQEPNGTVNQLTT